MPVVTMDKTSKAYQLLFNNVEWDKGEGAINGRPYWLASRGGYAYFSICAIYGAGAVSSEGGGTFTGAGIGIFHSYGFEDFDSMGVRPVIVLGAEVTKDVIGKIAESDTIPNWQYTRNYSVSE